MGSVELALHSIKAKVVKSDIDSKASSFLVPIWVKVFGIPSPTKSTDLVKELVSTVGEPLEVDELSLMKVDPVKVKLYYRDPHSINGFVEIFINGVGYELRFEAEGLPEKQKKLPIKGSSHQDRDRKKDKDDEEEEEDSNDNDHQTEWNKLVERFGGSLFQLIKVVETLLKPKLRIRRCRTLRFLFKAKS